MKSDVHVKLVFKWVLPNNESDIDRTITTKTKVRGTIFSLIIQNLSMDIDNHALKRGNWAAAGVSPDFLKKLLDCNRDTSEILL